MTSDWLRERIERYHMEIARKEGAGRRLIVGPILAEVQREWNHSAIRLTVEGCEITVQASPMGQRVYVTIEDGSAHVLVSRRDRDGRWT